LRVFLTQCPSRLGDLIHREPQGEVEELLRQPLERLGIELRLVASVTTVRGRPYFFMIRLRSFSAAAGYPSI
jgi:hypothetical protein